MCAKVHAWRLGENADWNTHTVLNACPQKHKLNNGIWKSLENMTAKWADEYDAVWIISGPIIIDKKPTKWLGQPGEIPVAIPDAFFKIVIREKDGKIDVLSLIYPHKEDFKKVNKKYAHAEFLTSVDEIEALTGLDFDIEEPAESIVQVRVWE